MLMFMGEMINAYKIFVRKPVEKNSLRRPKHRCEEKIEIYNSQLLLLLLVLLLLLLLLLLFLSLSFFLKEMEREGAVSIRLPPNRSSGGFLSTR
jgi:hypothetical protein